MDQFEDVSEREQRFHQFIRQHIVSILLNKLFLSVKEAGKE